MTRKNRMISILLALAMLVSWILPAAASGSVTDGGDGQTVPGQDPNPVLVGNTAVQMVGARGGQIRIIQG